MPAPLIHIEITLTLTADAYCRHAIAFATARDRGHAADAAAALRRDTRHGLLATYRRVIAIKAEPPLRRQLTGRWPATTHCRYRDAVAYFIYCRAAITPAQPTAAAATLLRH